MMLKGISKASRAVVFFATLALAACGGMPRHLPPLEREISLVGMDPAQIEFVAALSRRVEQERSGDFIGQYEGATDLVRKQMGPAESFAAEAKRSQPFQVLSFRPDYIPKGDREWTVVSGCGWTRSFLFYSQEKLLLMLNCEWDGRHWAFGFFRVMGPMGHSPEKCK